MTLPNVNVRAGSAHNHRCAAAKSAIESERRTVEPFRLDAGEGELGCGDEGSRCGFRYDSSSERCNCRNSATRDTTRTAGDFVRIFVHVSAVRAAIFAMCVARFMVRSVIVRGGHAGMIVAQRHA
jgi:hypothetical protein